MQVHNAITMDAAQAAPVRSTIHECQRYRAKMYSEMEQRDLSCSPIISNCSHTGH